MCHLIRTLSHCASCFESETLEINFLSGHFTHYKLFYSVSKDYCFIDHCPSRLLQRNERNKMKNSI